MHLSLRLILPHLVWIGLRIPKAKYGEYGSCEKHAASVIYQLESEFSNFKRWKWCRWSASSIFSPSLSHLALRSPFFHFEFAIFLFGHTFPNFGCPSLTTTFCAPPPSYYGFLIFWETKSSSSSFCLLPFPLFPLPSFCFLFHQTVLPSPTRLLPPRGPGAQLWLVWSSFYAFSNRVVFVTVDTW